jgi:hypothetical protein
MLGDYDTMSAADRGSPSLDHVWYEPADNSKAERTPRAAQ